MTRVEVRICNTLGLHARAAAKFVHLANGFKSRILVGRGGTTVDGKSILGLLALAAAKDTRLQLSAEGDDAEQALRALQELVADCFGEKQ
jgi:phosphocarrier protein HPr